ncbi:MAG: hypothetical protein GZ086_02840 [Gelidibacter sp.]|nr:hypothetical protein [Gelidibacter sp.]
MWKFKILMIRALSIGIIALCNTVYANFHMHSLSSAISENTLQKDDEKPIKIVKDSTSIYVEYLEVGNIKNQLKQLAKYNVNVTPNARITQFRNNLYQVVISEIDRGDYTEINGELEYLSEGSSCITLRIILPLNGHKWKWFSGLEKSDIMRMDSTYNDTVEISTVLPPDGAFNGQTLADGGYGDPVGQGSMSFYPLCAVSIDHKGEGLGIDMSLPVVYRLSAEINKGLIAEFDFATSPLTEKFPNRAFFKLSHFNFNANWGMRAALEKYYTIYPESFKKRVVTEGIWLPFTALRSIPDWEDFGFAFHETSWNNSDEMNGKPLPNIISDKGTGVLSFQYTEPWDIQLPIFTKDIDYEALISDKMIPSEHLKYIKSSATEDKNGLWQTRRLETPWFSSGWAMSITTNCDPDLEGYNRYQYVRQDEIEPAKNECGWYLF